MFSRFLRCLPKQRLSQSYTKFTPYSNPLTSFYSRGIQRRQLTLSSGQRGALRGWGTIVNIIAGAYFGGLLVCGGSLYLIYSDANNRQHIPFELSFNDILDSVKAIDKDDVFKSPRYAVKHYRRVLINIAKESDSNLEFDESKLSEEDWYDIPIIDANVLVYEKSNDFANFYIDFVLRYAKALLAKGNLSSSIHILKSIVDNDEIFFKLGDAERLSQCCRLLTRVSSEPQDKVQYLLRSLDMLEMTFASIKMDDNYLLQDGSRITDELIICLNNLATVMAKQSSNRKYSKHDREDYLSKSLNIYLANLKILNEMNEKIKSGEKSQASYPLFNCDEENLAITLAEIKAHISEVMWAKGYKKNAILWGEEVIDDIYFQRNTYLKASPILINVFKNLIIMYDKSKNIRAKNRCQDLLLDVTVFEAENKSWYDGFINRVCKIVYNRGPLGVIEKPLLERFGAPRRLPELEEFEDEDVE